MLWQILWSLECMSDMIRHSAAQGFSALSHLPPSSCLFHSANNAATWGCHHTQMPEAPVCACCAHRSDSKKGTLSLCMMLSQLNQRLRNVAFNTVLNKQWPSQQLLLASHMLPPSSSSMSASYTTDAPKTATPPADTSRGATADLCDVHITNSVDVVSSGKVSIMEPIFR